MIMADLQFWFNNGAIVSIPTVPTVSATTNESLLALLRETDGGLVGFWESSTPQQTVASYALASGGFMPSQVRLPPKTVTFKLLSARHNGATNNLDALRTKIRDLCALLTVGVRTVSVAGHGLLLDGYLADAPLIEWSNGGHDVAISFTLTFTVPLVLPSTTFSNPAAASVQATSLTATSATYTANQNELKQTWLALGAQITATSTSAVTKLIDVYTYRGEQSTRIHGYTFQLPFSSRQTRNFIILGGHAYIAGSPYNMWERVPLLTASGVSSYFPPLQNTQTLTVTTTTANIRPRIFKGWC